MRFAPLSSQTRSISRRSFLRAAGFGSAGLLVGQRVFPPAAVAGGLDIPSLARMEFEVTYRTEIMNLPRDAEEVHIWMPRPPSDHAQEIANLTVSCPLPHEITRDPTYGTRMIHAVGGRQPTPFAVESRYQVTRKRVGAQTAELDEQSAQKYLRLTRRVRVTEDVEAFARKAVGQAREPYEVGRKVFDAIIDHLDYDKTLPGCGTGDTAWIMKYRRGKCDDYHALFMAVMISRGIPVRWEQGFPLPLPTGPTGATNADRASGQLSGDCSGAHCWASFYDPAHGWVPVDVSEGDKTGAQGSYFFGNLSPNRFQVSEGRSIVLEPAQGGDPLPTFAFAYAESDGIPLIYHANYENIIGYKITNVEFS